LDAGFVVDAGLAGLGADRGRRCDWRGAGVGGVTEIDWNRPLVTNAGKPAKVVKYDEGDADWPYDVFAQWPEDDRPESYWCNSEGEATVSEPECPHTIRNATPAEVLAHPDTWPQWQDWARQEQGISEGMARLQGDLTRHTDEGVFVTWEDVTTAARLMCVEATTLAAALGVPPEPPKFAPWEAAYEAWAGEQGSGGIAKAPWQAAVQWCVGQMSATVVVCDANSGKHVQRYATEFRRKIMGDDA
jgi:hypothetical protein